MIDSSSSGSNSIWVHNVASPEMLYCSSSSGEHFDRRARELRQCPSVVEGIILNANRPTEPKTENNKTPQP